MSATGIAVCHLVRHANGIDPLRRFLGSYRRHPAGLEHELVAILKGFPGNRVTPEVGDELASVPHRCLFAADWGYDITAYFKAASELGHAALCFMNSFSEILADDWLRKLHDAVSRPGAGAAGATGSYQGYMPGWRAMPDAELVAVRSPWKKKLLGIPLVERLNALRRRRQFPVFPNPHLRTNAFLIRRGDMLALRPHRTHTKRQAYSFESGRDSMTAQLSRLGKSVYVVGADGIAYGISDWMRSRTFWIDEQQNLMVADNQTRRYRGASAREKAAFTWHAWGAAGLDEAGALRAAAE